EHHPVSDDPGWRSRAHGPSARTAMVASEPDPDPGNHRRSSRIRALFDGSQLERSNHESVWARIKWILHDGWEVSSAFGAAAAGRVLYCRARLCARKMILAQWRRIPHDRPIRHARKRGQTWMALAGSGGAVSPFSRCQASQAAIVSGARRVSTERG